MHDTLQRIYRPILSDLDQMGAVIRHRLQSPVPLINQVSAYIVSSGGKRLRPGLLLLAARVGGYQGQTHYDLAAAVEFVHTATLLHDDVVDNSEMRRGRKTSNLQFGNPTAVLVGDFLYSRAFLAMVEVGLLEALGVLAEATNVISEGEILQLSQCGNLHLQVDDYLQIVRQKTAKLFEAAARIGALLHPDPHPDWSHSLGCYGMALGTAFQIVDDVLDYSGEETAIGKRLGDDLREGKMTLPLIYALQEAPPAISARIGAAITQGLQEGDELLIMQTIQNSQAKARAMELAAVESRRALAALSGFPDSECKESLAELARFAVSRDH